MIDQTLTVRGNVGPVPDADRKEHAVPSFSNTLEQAIHSALELANSRSHEFATLEHLLLALID